MNANAETQPLPHSADAERALLGCLLLSPKSIAETARQIGPESFYDFRHRLIYRTLEEMAAEGKAVDLLTVTNELRDRGRLDNASGHGYITSIVSETPTAANLKAVVEIVREKAGRRQLLGLADRIRERAGGNGANYEDVVRDTRRDFDLLEEQSKPAHERLEGAVVSSAELQSMALPSHETLLAPFWCEGNLGFIYAPRGDGKTWLAMLLAIAVSTGGKAGSWEAGKARPVLYVDGEMPGEETRRRLSALGGAGENLLWLHHEVYFERTGRMLNLADPRTQADLTDLALKRGIRVLILDNLSCLFSGVKENDADSWEQVLLWVLNLRRLRISVVIVAHAGRNGNMRGTSRREDAAFWILKLERSQSDDSHFRGVKFTSLFTKNRNSLEEDCPALEWTITAENDGTANVTTQPVSGVDLFVNWVNEGLDSASDIAAEMGISKGQVSKLAKKAEAAGRIRVERRRYLPADGGANA